MMRKTLYRRMAGVCCALALLTLVPAALQAGREPTADPDVPEAVDLLRQYGWTSLHWAARHGQGAAIQRLIAGGAVIDAREHLDRTPLHLAAMAGHRDTVEQLLSHGANVNARDRWNVTPLRRLELLTQARGWERSDIKRLLEDSGGTR